MRICLINMPFAALNMPSLALTQLKSIAGKRFGEQIQIDDLYLNQEFAKYIGVDLYTFIATSMEAHNSGFGDWFFRQAAFPNLTHNTDEYFRRYFPMRTPQLEAFKRRVLEKRQGVEQFIDALIEEHGLDQAAIAGFTSMFNQNTACFALARRLKERNPNIITIMGGANCEAPMGNEIARNVEPIDYVFSGPALKSFLHFIQYSLDKEWEKCGKIKGVFSKSNEASPSPQAMIGDELDINESVELDYEPFLRALENQFPDEEVKPTLLFETSRGCWWGERAHCTFCGLNGLTMNYRAMAAEKALDQFKTLFSYASRCSRFESVDNILPKSYLEEVFPFLDTPPGVSLFYEVKADLTEKEIEVLSKARVKYIQPGIESLATSTLKLMKKGTTSFQNLAFLKDCLKHDLHPVWNLLIGFPGEDEEVYRKYVNDIPLLVHLTPPTGAFPVRFDRYSPYFVQAEQYGLNLRPSDFYKFIYPFSAQSLANLAYYFTDHNFSAEYITMMVRWIDKVREKVNLWSSRWRNVNQNSNPPILSFKERSTVIYDSRSGNVVEHQVGDVGKQILERMDKPKRLSMLASDFSHIPNFDPAKEVALLQDKGLIFQEGDRFISLVLTEKSAEPAANTHD